MDNAVSKTINMAEDYSVKDMDKVWLEYLPFLKGTTFYRDNSRKFYNEETGEELEPPLTPIPIEEAIKRRDSEKIAVDTAETDDCASGVCEV